MASYSYRTYRYVAVHLAEQLGRRVSAEPAKNTYRVEMTEVGGSVTRFRSWEDAVNKLTKRLIDAGLTPVLTV